MHFTRVGVALTAALLLAGGNTCIGQQPLAAGGYPNSDYASRASTGWKPTPQNGQRVSRPRTAQAGTEWSSLKEPGATERSDRLSSTHGGRSIAADNPEANPLSGKWPNWYYPRQEAGSTLPVPEFHLQPARRMKASSGTARTEWAPRVGGDERSGGQQRGREAPPSHYAQGLSPSAPAQDELLNYPSASDTRAQPQRGAEKIRSGLTRVDLAQGTIQQSPVPVPVPMPSEAQIPTPTLSPPVPGCPTDPFAPEWCEQPLPVRPLGPAARFPQFMASGVSGFHAARGINPEAYAFGVLEKFRQSGTDSRLASRLGFNLGLPLLIQEYGSWGAQLGGSVSGAESGGQFFFTGGLFYRGAMQLGNAWNFGIVLDWIDDDAFTVDVAQLRIKTGITTAPQNEWGLWGTVSVEDDSTPRFRTMEAVDQLNVFYRYLWPSGTAQAIWVGWRNHPDTAAIGTDASRPLGDLWALATGAYYGFSSDTWNVYTGLVLHFGNHASEQYLGERRFMPYLPVADNTRMTLFVD